MGSLSIWHWIIVLVVVLLVFGKGKIPTLMGDVAKGIKDFKKNIKDPADETSEAKVINNDDAPETAMAKEKDEAAST